MSLTLSPTQGTPRVDLTPPRDTDLFGYHLPADIATLADMSLLETLVRKHEDAQPLRGVSALLIQHQLANSAPQLEALQRLGLAPDRTFWLDIPYTSSARFRLTVGDRLGIPEDNFWVNRYRVLDPYSTHQLRRTQEIFRHVARQCPGRLLVLDDGAYFLEAAMMFDRQLNGVGIVEQTTRGVIKLEENTSLGRYARRFRVVNVARSRPKLVLEAPWIATAVRAALVHHLGLLAEEAPTFTVNRDSPCLVLGFGAIGRRIAEHLSTIAQVYVFDTRRERRIEAKAAGFPIWKRGAKPRFKLVVGCTGRPSFSIGDHVHLDDHAVLVSASSGAVELSRHEFIEYAAASQIDDVTLETQSLVEDRLHQPLWMRLVNRRIVFLNAGFPINFDGRLSCIPARYMQPTAVLMVAGALEAMRATRPGLIPIDETLGQELIRSFFECLNERERNALDLPAADRP